MFRFVDANRKSRVAGANVHDIDTSTTSSYTKHLAADLQLTLISTMHPPSGLPDQANLVLRRFQKHVPTVAFRRPSLYADLPIPVSAPVCQIVLVLEQEAGGVMLSSHARKLRKKLDGSRFGVRCRRRRGSKAGLKEAG